MVAAGPDSVGVSGRWLSVPLLTLVVSAAVILVDVWCGSRDAGEAITSLLPSMGSGRSWAKELAVWLVSDPRLSDLSVRIEGGDI